MWLIMAALSALFAGLTAILAKCGIKKTDSDVATALRTVVVLLFAWIMVFIVGSAGTITEISAKSILFLILSGLATGASWLCYFKALSVGDVNKVVPVDKSSTVLTVLLAIILFSETEHLAVKLIGTALLAAGVFLMIEKKKTEAKDTKRTCACFITWCGGQCGYVKEDLLPMTSSPWVQMDFFKQRNQWVAAGTEPSPGMIVFYDYYGNGMPDHVGIIENVENGEVHSIEGNWGDSVQRVTRVLGDPEVMGYGWIVEK